MSVERNDGKMPGGVTGKGFQPGQTGNAGGLPSWVREARAAMRGGLFDLAARHVRWVLSGQEPPDATEAERRMYGDVGIRDRNEAADLVFAYTLPKPKANMALKHEGQAGPVVVEVRTLAEEEKKS